MSDNWIKIICTFFNVGKFPFAPGTLASAVGVLIYSVLEKNYFVYFMFLTACLVVGFKACAKIEAIFNQKDPSSVVIDEVAGVLIAFFALPLSWPVVITTFFLFRAFDMFKLYPVNKFDNMEGGFGIMMDDVVAGIYTNVTMQIAVRWAGII